jgi:hypothetical protein
MLCLERLDNKKQNRPHYSDKLLVFTSEEKEEFKDVKENVNLI